MEKFIKNLLEWRDYIVYFSAKPFEASDVIAINLIVPHVREGEYNQDETWGSFTYPIYSKGDLIDILDRIGEGIEVTIQFVLSNGSCRYMTISSHPQKINIVELDNMIEDLEKSVVDYYLLQKDEDMETTKEAEATKNCKIVAIIEASDLDTAEEIAFSNGFNNNDYIVSRYSNFKRADKIIKLH